MAVAEYTFNSDRIPTEGVNWTPGESQQVQFTCDPDHVSWITERLYQLFEGRDEVILVGSGLTEKLGLGFIMLQFDGCQMDPTFRRILETEQFIIDFSVDVLHEEEE